MALEQNIKELEAELKRLKIIKAAVEKIYDCPLDDFPFPERFLKVIKNPPYPTYPDYFPVPWEPMFTIREIVSLSEQEVRRIPGIGEKTFKEATEVLTILGLWWGMIKNKTTEE